MNFPCTKCGLCCRHIANIEPLKNFDNGKGVCIHLNLKTNLCEIYETRPTICRVDEVYKKYFHNFYTEQKFIDLNIKSCKELQSKYKD